MRVRAALAARRTLVKLLLSLASAYAIALVLTRESTDIVVEAAFKKVIRKVHPDKGGRNADAQKLNAAKEAWDPSRMRAFFILESARLNSKNPPYPLRKLFNSESMRNRSSAALTWNGFQPPFPPETPNAGLGIWCWGRRIFSRQIACL